MKRIGVLLHYWISRAIFTWLQETWGEVADSGYQWARLVLRPDQTGRAYLSPSAAGTNLKSLRGKVSSEIFGPPSCGVTLTEPAANPEIATKAKTLPTASVTGPRSEANPGGEGLPLYAYGVEFVTLPGESDKLRTEIPFLVRAANEKSRGFSGCLVLVSEQEARLVTVITLWMTRDGEKECHEKRLKRQLEPYVDRWLRTRRFVTFLSMSFGKDFWQREA